jgi:ferredoxin
MDKLTVTINRDKCQGYGKCAQQAPDTFSLDGENKVVMGDPAATADPKMLVRAAKSCPYRVITVSDDNGQIFPPVKKTAEA